jgi:hypothetical protein
MTHVDGKSPYPIVLYTNVYNYDEATWKKQHCKCSWTQQPDKFSWDSHYGLGWVEVRQNSAISSQKSLSLRNRRPKNLGDKTDTHKKKQLKAKVRGR